jgi:uncharacterized protein (DUF433 family)
LNADTVTLPLRETQLAVSELVEMVAAGREPAEVAVLA